MNRLGIIPVISAALVSSVLAKVDLTTVPSRDTVQLTIYNSADMTFVREQRALTLKEGMNKLQFSWANTLIDPTSLEMTPKANGDKIDVQELIYPPRVKNLGLWNVNSQITGKSPVEIRYLTSGLSWRAFYMGTLSPDETQLHLQGYVRVTNNSGEDYENAQTRLIVGKVHMLDQIATLAQREYPYGRPDGNITVFGSSLSVTTDSPALGEVLYADGFDMMERAGKSIVKEELSEYFLYTIEGTESIPNGWSKRLPSFDTDAIPVINLYKFEKERYGNQVRRCLSFKNDEEHKLGETPIPGGAMRVFRSTGENGHLGFEGQSSFQYIPVNEKVELDLGRVENVVVDAKVMKTKTGNYQFSNKGNITGWNTIQDVQIEVRNTRSVPIKIELKRNFNSTHWTLEKNGDFGVFEKDDKDSVKFTIELPPRSNKTFSYTLTTYHGNNQERK